MSNELVHTQLHQRYPDLVNTPGSPGVGNEALADALTGIWNGTPASRLYTSITCRGAAVIKAVPYITGKRLITGNWRINRYIYLAPNLDLSTRVEAVTGKVEVREVLAERCMVECSACHSTHT